MKSRDLSVIVASAVVSGIFAFVLSNFIFGGEKSYNLKAPKVEEISAEFVQPDSKYFNRGSINPTKLITIGDSGSEDPFNKPGN